MSRRRGSIVVFQVINEKEIQAGIEPILCFMWSNTCKLFQTQLNNNKERANTMEEKVNESKEFRASRHTNDLI